MPIDLLVSFPYAASAVAGTRISGTLINLNANPSVSLNTFTLGQPSTLADASVPAAASQGNAAMAIMSDSGGRVGLGTETQLTQTTVFNPNTKKNIKLIGGTYSFEAVLTAAAAAAAGTTNLAIHIR